MRFNTVFKEDGFEILEGVIARGIATLYYEQGCPLAASAELVNKQGLKISWLNVARQFQQQGFSNEKIISEFRELLSFCSGEVEIETIESFILLDDEAQKEEIWKFWQDKLIVE